MAELIAVGPGLPPLHGENAKILLLGSFPSPKSRQQGFYYGHPQNRFWPLLAALTGENTPAHDDIAAKKAIILNSGFALWDTIQSCKIKGASDASIRDVVPNDLATLIAALGVQAVFCNGAASARLYARWQQPLTGVAATCLPSTSPANAAFTMPRLQAEWGAALRPWLPEKNNL